MKCTSCERHDARWVLIDYDNIQLLCGICYQETCSMEGEINLDFYHINLGWAPIFEHINRNLKYLDEKYGSLLKEYSKFKKEAGKSEAIEALMRKQPYINVTPRGQYSIQSTSNADRLVKEIMIILFPDEEDKE